MPRPMRRYRSDLAAVQAAEEPRPYVVRMADQAGDRHEVAIEAAYGRFDACNQARLEHPQCTLIDAVPA